MLLSVWKPFYTKGIISHYKLVDKNELNNKKGISAYKVIWLCDNQNCKTPNMQHSISACHFNKPKLNISIQICRNCQCTGEGNGRYGDKRKWADFFNEEKLKVMKENYSKRWLGDNNPSVSDMVKIKKGQPIINQEYIKHKVESMNYKLVEIIEVKGKKSTFIIECEKNHISKKTYSNFLIGKKFLCQKCFYDSIKINMSEKEIEEVENYYKIVRSLSAQTYKKYKNIINPNNFKIGKKSYHMDHKYSISEGYKNGIKPEIISSKENLEIIPAKENLSKQQRCSITLNELIEKTNYLYYK